MAATASHNCQPSTACQNQGRNGVVSSMGSQVEYSCVVCGASSRARRLPSSR